MIDFPANPVPGQQFTAAGVTWTWDGTKWTAGGQSVAYLPLAGGTMLGPIVLAADPTAALQPATKQYVDGGRLGDNRIINGDMRIDQRNNGAAGSAVGYTVDRWAYNASQTNRIGWQRNPAGPSGFPYSLLASVSNAFTSAAGDYFMFYQPIEADMISDFAWGTANAQPVTLSFWVFSSLTGTFSGSIRNGATTRTYPFSYSIPTANIWTKIVITIPGDTGGTWTLSGNGAGLLLSFDLGCGSTYRGPANAWTSANYVGVTGAVSVVATNGATFYVTGVKLEISSIATPFNRQSLAKSMADCQRYYQTGNGQTLGYASAASVNIGGYHPFPVSMRATPTITPTWTTQTNATGALSAISNLAYQLYGTSTAVAQVNCTCTWVASAEL